MNNRARESTANVKIIDLRALKGWRFTHCGNIREKVGAGRSHGSALPACEL